MTQTGDAAEAGLRGRYRSLVRGEAKQVALRQLAEGGPAALSINAIGRELGVSGPALYRYFAGRDELLTELVVDAYLDLTSALSAANGRAGGQSAVQRLRVFAGAYRGWANAEPHRYRLLFAAPLPGYDAQSERLVTASKGAMRVLLDVLTELVPDSAGAWRAEDEPTVLDGQLDQWSRSRELPGVPAVALWAITIWSRLHGFVRLEIEGNFTSMGLDAELLFDAEVRAMLTPPT